MSCPKGQIKRASYKRKSYKKKDSTIVKATRVPATCIIDRGNPGRGVKLYEVTKPQLLRSYGYSTDESYEDRKISLKRAMTHEDPLEVLRHLNAIRTLQRANPEIYNKMDKDMKYIQVEYKRISSKKISKKGSKKISKKGSKKTSKRRK